MHTGTELDDPGGRVMATLEEFCPGFADHLLAVADRAGLDGVIDELLRTLAGEFRHNDGLERWVDMLSNQIAVGGRPDLQIHTGHRPGDPDALPPDYLCGALPAPRPDPIPAQHRPD